MLQQSVNTDPHPLSDLVGGDAAHDVDDSSDPITLPDNVFDDF